jgi:hypothetical protein
MQSNIAYCKRLGEPGPGHVRPLLVILSSAEEAQWIVSNAKWLRHSHDSSVSEHVYININRTKEEARLAYEQRCRRRTAHHQETSNGSRPASSTNNEPCNIDRCTTRGSRIVVNSSRAASNNRVAGRSDSPSSARPAGAALSSLSTTTRPAWSQRASGAASDSGDAATPRQEESESTDIPTQSTATDVTVPSTPPSMCAMLAKPVDKSATVTTSQQLTADTRPCPNSFNIAAAEFHLSASAAAAAATGNAGSSASRIDRL